MIAYKITNKVTGKIYIGITTRTAEQRFDGHIYDARRSKRVIRPLHAALRRYPFDCWEVETIGSAPTWEALCNLERSLISEYRSTERAIGYNVALGGEGTLGCIQSAEVRERRAAKIRGVPRPPEVRARISAGNKGKPKSAEHMAKSLATRRAMNFKKTPEQIEKSARAHRGRKRSAETCRKISEAAKRRYREKDHAPLFDL